MAKPRLVKDIRTGSLGSYLSGVAALGDLLFFSADNGIDGVELWMSDGKATTLVSDISPGQDSSNPSNITALGNTLYFTASDKNSAGFSNREIWRVTGGKVTSVVTNFGRDIDIVDWNLVPVKNVVYFAPKRREELWLIDSAQTYKVLDSGTTIKPPSPRNLAEFKGSLFFTADDFYAGRELWRYEDVYPYIPHIVSDIEAGKASSNPTLLTAVGDKIYFSAFTSQSGRELWKSDGNLSSIVSDIRRGNPSSDPNNLTRVGNILYFTAYTDDRGRELWMTDGTKTRLVSDIRPGATGSYPTSLIAVGDTLIFSADNGLQGRELWGVTNGKITRNFDIYSGSFGSTPSNLTVVGNTLYFTANNGRGVELWKMHNSTVNLVADINPGIFGSNPSNLTVVGGSLFFSASDGTYGSELWMLDVTDELKTSIPLITAITDNDGLIQGKVANSGLTNDRTPTISGKLTAPLASGESIRVFNASKLLGNATVNIKNLSWSFTPTLPVPAANGTRYIISARVSRVNGTLGEASAPRSFTLDRTAPATTAEITALIDKIGIVQGSIVQGGPTDDRTPTLRGTISASLLSGETLRIYNGTMLLGTAKVNNTAKTWSFTPTLPQPLGRGSTYRITARVADAAGNLGRTSAARTFTLSTTPDISINNIEYSGLDGKNQPFKMMNHNTLLVSERKDGVVRFRASGNGGLTNGLPTFVYAHGWKDSYTSDNSKLLFEKLTTTLKGAANVLLVDWSGLAKEWPIKLKPSTTWFEPLSEATVTKQVGETVADALIRAGAAIDKITLIGHSLGSFVMASAANEIRNRTGVKVKELVALDTAFGSGTGYDIDARNGGVDRPFSFSTNLATTTTSYTVSDLTGPGAIAGDNPRAATAQHAYLVQYVKSTYPASLALAAPADLHNGVVGIYADLFVKNSLHPSSVRINQKPILNTQNSLDQSGRPIAKGLFDGVIAAAQPWTWRMNSGKQDPKFQAPKAIGWTESYRDPIIYGSNADDVMFFDQFKDSGSSSWLVGRDGNDWLVGGNTGTKGIDRLIGGAGSDQFWFGYQRYGKVHYPYLDKNDKTGYGGGVFAIITDFDQNQDFLNFIWPETQMTRKSGSLINDSFVSNYGSGVGFLSNNDLIAYLPGLALPQVDTLIANKRISFGQIAQLDSALLA